jgi:S-adenosylmethionine-diacylgycerolhomoserine-N-methlytransferase
MVIADDDNVLEIGCGTGRNLILLGRKRPKANLFGLDASSEMLATAKEKISKNGQKIELRTALADDFAFDSTFGLDEPFDALFFSYSISMIPTWRESIDNALKNLRPGGVLYIVDFYDQKDLPRWFQKLLQEWLKKFHVQFWHDLMPYLNSLETDGLGSFILTPLYRRYSFIASFKKL